MDDGAHPQNWKEADLLILGVSRCGKTPLSIYLGQRGYKVGCSWPARMPGQASNYHPHVSGPCLIPAQQSTRDGHDSPSQGGGATGASSPASCDRAL